MKIPRWVPEEGAKYLSWSHALITRAADNHPPDEHVLRQKIQMLERIARADDMKVDVIEPLEKAGFRQWRDFYAFTTNQCAAAIMKTAYPFNIPPAEYKRKLRRFSETAKDLLNQWSHLNVGGLGYVENVPLEDSYDVAMRLQELVEEIETEKVTVLFGCFRVGHHHNLPRDEAAIGICEYLNKHFGRPGYRIVAAILRVSMIDCSASEETVRAIWRRRIHD